MADRQFALRQCVSILRQHGYILRCYSRYSIIKMTASLKIFTRRDGHWPSACEYSQRGETERECGKDFYNITGRAVAKTICAVLNANWPCAEHRTSNARPYKLWFIAIFHLNNGNILKNSAVYFRADAKAICSIFNANRPSGEERTSDARPYNDGVFLNNSPVGAAIGRPPTDRWEITAISDITGRAGAKATISILNPNCPSGEERTSDARPYDP